MHDSLRPARPHSERDRYLLELLDTTARTVERQTKRIERQDREELETLRLILRELQLIAKELALAPPPTSTPNSISFKETQ